MCVASIAGSTVQKLWMISVAECLGCELDIVSQDWCSGCPIHVCGSNGM